MTVVKYVFFDHFGYHKKSMVISIEPIDPYSDKAMQLMPAVGIIIGNRIVFRMKGNNVLKYLVYWVEISKHSIIRAKSVIIKTYYFVCLYWHIGKYMHLKTYDKIS